MSKVGHFVIDIERIVKEGYSDQYVVTLSGDRQITSVPFTMLNNALDNICAFIIDQVWNIENAQGATQSPEDDASERTL